MTARAPLALVVALALLMVPAQTIAAKVEVDFTGAASFKATALREALAQQIRDLDEFGLTPPSADDTAFFMRQFYRKHGWPEAEVDWKIVGPQLLMLRVNEGARAMLEAVRFHGNAQISDAELREHIIGITRERLDLRGDNVPFVEADIANGVERVRGLYRARGFMYAVVGEPEFQFSADRKKGSVDITITEGGAFRFAKPRFDGDLLFFPNEPLMKQLRPFTDGPYNPAQLTNIERAIIYFYRQRGYFDVRAGVEAHPELAANGEVPLDVRIQSGEVYHFDGVKVTGLERLSPEFLPARFGRLSGQLYNPEKLEEIHRDMMQTGLFKSLRIDSKPLASHQIEINIEAVEEKARELGFSAGYGTFEGPIIGLTAAERDLFGSGRPLSFSAEFAQRFLRGELAYEDPWFLHDTLDLRAKIYALQQNFDGYDKNELGGRLDLSRKLTSKLECGVDLVSRRVNATSTGMDPVAMGPSTYLLNSLGGYVTLDLRDSPVNPKRGLVVNATVEAASAIGGGSVQLIRTTGRISYYLPLGKTLLAVGARAGVLTAGGNLPIDERFFNGGSRSVRSFAERALGPKDRHGYPIGGESFTTFNAENVFPIYKDLSGAVFVDAGSVGAQGSGSLRYGIGAGLRYNLPVGPIRLDYGWNPSPRAGEATGAFHLSIGFAF